MKRMILLYESIGFVVIIFMVWVDEAIDLPNLVFNAPKTPFNFKEGICESIIVLIVATVTILFTINLLRRIRYLEAFLKICCMCKKICDANGNWVPFELFFDENSKIEFSHGFCPKCLEEFKKKTYDDIKKMKSKP